MRSELQDRIYFWLRNRNLGTRTASLVARVDDQSLHRYENVDALSCLQSEILHGYTEPWWSYWRIFVVAFFYLALGFLFGSMLDPQYLELSLELIVFLLVSGIGFFLVGMLFMEYLCQCHYGAWQTEAQQIIDDLEKLKTIG